MAQTLIAKNVIFLVSLAKEGIHKITAQVAKLIMIQTDLV